MGRRRRGEKTGATAQVKRSCILKDAPPITKASFVLSNLQNLLTATLEPGQTGLSNPRSHISSQTEGANPRGSTPLRREAATLYAASQMILHREEVSYVLL